MAQVLTPPATIALAVPAPRGVPPPTCPEAFDPQHFTDLSDHHKMAQVCLCPAVMAIAVSLLAKGLPAVSLITSVLELF